MVKVIHEKKALKQMMIVLVLLLSVEPTLVDLMEGVFQNDLPGLSMISINGSLSGYSVVNFALMYFVGAYIRLAGIDEKCSAGRAFAGLASCVFITSVWVLLKDIVGFDTTQTAWAYSNPVIIAEAAFLFVLFKKIPIGEIKVINHLAKASFTVYLLHIMFLQYMRIPEYCAKSIPVLLIHLCLICLIIYIICWICYVIYHFMENIFIRILQKVISFPTLSVENKETSI